MDITKIESVTGRLNAVGTMKETRRENRFTVGLKVDEDWYNMFGSQDKLTAIASGLEKGKEVEVKFKSRAFNDKVFREVISVSQIRQQEFNTPAPVTFLMPVSESYTILKDGKIDKESLSNALFLILSDCEFLIKEIGASA